MAEETQDVKQDLEFRKLLVALQGDLDTLLPSFKMLMKPYLSDADLNLPFLDICSALERLGHINPKKMDILKDAIKELHFPAYNKILSVEEKICQIAGTSQSKVPEVENAHVDEEPFNVSQTSKTQGQTGSVQLQYQPNQKKSTVFIERDAKESHNEVELSITVKDFTLRSAQIPIRIRGSKQCLHHRDMEVILVCKECSGELICATCVAGNHNGHSVARISEVIPQAKEKIKSFVNKTECMDLPMCREKVNNLDEEISRNEKHYNTVIAKIESQYNSLKENLKKIKDEMINMCKHCELENRYVIQNYKEELESKIEDLSAWLQVLNHTLRTGTETQLYDTCRKIPNDVTIPALPSLQDRDFNTTLIRIGQLQNIFGQLTKINNGNEIGLAANSLIEQNKCPTVEFEQHVATDTDKKRTTAPDVSRDEGQTCNINKTSEDVVVKFKLFKTFTHKGNICRIKAINDENRVWVKHGVRTLALLNTTGQVLKAIEMEVGIQDFCVLTSTGDIWFCSEDSSIRKVTGDKSTVKFYTESKPESICTSSDGNLLVGMERQIVKYTQCGKILCTSTKMEELPAVKHPNSICQCPVTRKIAVVDWNSRAYEGDDKKRVSIFSENLELLCSYYGSDTELFDPCDVCYSDIGDIYIADYNKSIQKISGNGEFVQTVYTERDKIAKCLCVQSNGDIWAVYDIWDIYGRTVKVLQKQ